MSDHADDWDNFEITDLERALSKTRDGTGLGTDLLEARTLKAAPSSAKQALVDQKNDWDTTGIVPAAHLQHGEIAGQS